MRAAYGAVRERVDAACRKVGRDPAGVAILPVTKAVPAARLRAALSAGMAAFGENRVQEAEAKTTDVPGARWELIGHLQSNKAARAVALFDVIHSVDTVDLALRLARLAGDAPHRRPSRRLPVYLQVNVDRDPSKSGFDPQDLPSALDELAAAPALEVRGLMTVGRLVDRPDDARPTFARLRQLSERLRAQTPSIGAELSMGMSADFEVAVEEGATVVRVGSAIFGGRRGAE